MKYLNKLLYKFNKSNLNPVSTPSEAGVKLTKNSEQATEKEINIY